MKPNNIFNLI